MVHLNGLKYMGQSKNYAKLYIWNDICLPFIYVSTDVVLHIAFRAESLVAAF